MLVAISYMDIDAASFVYEGLARIEVIVVMVVVHYIFKPELNVAPRWHFLSHYILPCSAIPIR